MDMFVLEGWIVSFGGSLLENGCFVKSTRRGKGKKGKKKGKRKG